MTRKEMSKIVDDLCDEISPAITKARDQLKAHEWRLEIMTEPSGEVLVSCHSTAKHTAKQSRKR